MGVNTTDISSTVVPIKMEQYVKDDLPQYLLGGTGIYLVLPMILIFLR